MYDTLTSRIEQTHREFTRLDTEIGAWIDAWRKRDRLQQFCTQLDALGGVLSRIIGQLAAMIPKTANGRSRAAIYVACRKSDRQLVATRRLWEFFQRRLDQRLDGRFARVLKAADEVVWSCFTEVFRNGGLPPAPSPLACIEPLYSAQAIPRASPPQELRQENLLAACANRMPLALVSLPPDCVDNPWWLVLIGHEVGHHVQYELAGDGRLVVDFGALLKTAATEAARAAFDGDEEALADYGDRWSSWGQEIFADTFSLHAVGPAALWAMSELEADEPEAMWRERFGDRAAYPAALVRLGLMETVRGQLGPAAPAAPAGPVPAAFPGNRDPQGRCAFDLAVAAQLAPRLCAQEVSGQATLRKLCGWRAAEFAAGGAVHSWANSLRGRAALYPEPTLRAARLIVSGAVRAYEEVAGIADETQRDEAREQLRDTLLDVVAQSREEGTREGSDPRVVQTEELGDDLARLIAGETAE